MSDVAVPVLVFLVCFGVGILATARWLPELAAGPVGGLAFFTVCGMLSVALGLAGLHTFSGINELDHPALFPNLSKPEIVAGVLRNVIFNCGTLVGLAGVVYLLAPRLGEESLGETATALTADVHGGSES